jgi:hypothetical protein
MVLGRRYVARRTFGAAPGQRFVAGGRYTLRSVGHSHHDARTVFTFEETSTGTLHTWWWSDDAPVDECDELFAPATPEDA